jgi:hypothetical protein
MRPPGKVAFSVFCAKKLLLAVFGKLRYVPRANRFSRTPNKGYAILAAAYSDAQRNKRPRLNSDHDVRRIEAVEREISYELCAVARSLVVNAQSIPDMLRALDIHAVTCPCVPPAPGARVLASEASA